jgi:iron complex outermembrane receptor protein
MLFKKFLVFIMMLSMSSSIMAFSELSKGEAEIMTSIASGRMVEKDKVAAVVSVILEEEIEKIGAFSIEEVLETIPGLHVVKDSYIRSNKYVFRGIGTTFNQEALFLINNVPIKSNATGNRANAGFAGMPVDNIERIEVIRGPNSALYGADAYSGIINIVLKERDYSGDAFKVKGRSGNMDTDAAFVEYSDKITNDLSFYSSFNYEKTNGNEEVVDYDAQSKLDEMFFTDVSNAPTSPNFNKEMFDYYVSIDYKNLNVKYLKQIRKDLGAGFSANDVITKSGSFNNERDLVDLSYKKDFEDVTLNFNASYFLMDEHSNDFAKLYPDGAFGGLFPNGVVSTPERKEENTNVGFKTTYSGIEDNYIQLGFGYSKNKIFDIKDYRNFDMLTMTPLPNGIVNISETNQDPFLTPRTRENYYIFLQDEYYLKKDWILTTGVRYDHYNDFGETINPRLALVWNTNRKLTSKLLYGRAFRAPSFVELHGKSNPIATGNNSLSAATIDTYEISFNYALTTKSNLNWNLFYYESKDQIEPKSLSTGGAIFENIGETSGYGAEVEFDHQFDQNISFYTNYSYQQSDNHLTNEDTVLHPAHLFYARLSFDYPDWNFNLQGNWVGTRKRAEGDLRSDLRGYHKVDFNITRKNILDINGLDAKLYVKNLMDEDIREPSIIGDIKNDYPMPGRNAHLGISYQF